MNMYANECTFSQGGYFFFPRWYKRLHLFVGPLIRWSVGLLVGWSVGRSLYCFAPGELMPGLSFALVYEEDFIDSAKNLNYFCHFLMDDQIKKEIMETT
jgi:hypothetical protein